MLSEPSQPFALTVIIFYMIRYNMKLLRHFRDGIKIHSAQL